MSANEVGRPNGTPSTTRPRADRCGWIECKISDTLSPHMIWILQCLHFDQHGEVCQHTESSRQFHIRAGVRRMCAKPAFFFVWRSIGMGNASMEVGSA